MSINVEGLSGVSADSGLLLCILPLVVVVVLAMLVSSIIAAANRNRERAAMDNMIRLMAIQAARELDYESQGCFSGIAFALLIPLLTLLTLLLIPVLAGATMR